ncbi:MAG: hypothetical protein VX000_17155 [Myxococcota bacterium]|nr:hypothetical protein [Myxococcota bacterium]
MRSLAAVTLLCSGVACEGNPDGPTSGERTLLLAYQNNVGGDIEPCG